MKYYIIAGEASGDLHGYNLIKQLQTLDPNAQYRIWGGDLMASVAGNPVKHIKDLAFMGFVEVLANIRTILSNIASCKQDIIQYQPDVLVLVDYPGFNLRIAEFAKGNGFKVVYYISPQIWAWKQSRVHQIKRNVDRMLVILPFEKDFYSKFDVAADFVGHPLLDALPATSIKPNLQSNTVTVALLPGSRKQEIKRILPVMLQVAAMNPQLKFTLAEAPAIPSAYYNQFISDQMKAQIERVKGDTYGLLSRADVALVTSGTATLETALFGVPEVVCYKGGQLSYWIARVLVKIKFISLVNLIMDREVVRELIQSECNAKVLHHELQQLLDPAHAKIIKNDFDSLTQRLGGRGASLRAAQIVYDEANKS